MNSKIVFKQLLGGVAHKLLKQPDAPVVVLNYHSVGGGSRKSACKIEFEEHLDAVVNKWQLSVIDWQNKNKHYASKSAPSVLFSFDDGYEDNYHIVAPILEKYGVKGLFFLTSGYLDGDFDITQGVSAYEGLKPMTWGNAHDMQMRGHTMALHGHTHKSFSRLSQSEAREEFTMSSAAFVNSLGASSNSFAYPFGQRHHQRKDLNRIIEGLGVQYIFTTENKRMDAALLHTEDKGVVIIPRIRIDPGDSVIVLKQKIFGLWDYIAYVQLIKSKIPSLLRG